MTIRIESISFNHRPATPATAALTIRKNQSDEVTVPEWQNGMIDPESSPAAYTLNQIISNRLTIKAEFRRDSDRDPASVTVRTVAQRGNVLGNVISRTINFGTSLSTVALFELASPSGNPGVGVWDIAWDWFAGADSLQTTRHRIYTLAGAPQPPWGQTGSSYTGFQVPWTEVLDHACRQAAGARTVDEAADRLTRWINSLGASRLQYDQSGGASLFTVGNMETFKCTRFLEVLAAPPGTRARVNCTDCATILSSFANILGCNLVQSRIGYRFETNLIQKIGLRYPRRQPFMFHEAAWKFPSNGDAFVYDSCLLFDGDNNLADDNFQPTLGINKPLGVPGREGYHFRVIAPTRAGGNAGERRLTRMQRRIDGRTTTRAPIVPEQQRLLADEHEFSTWKGTSTPEVTPPCKCYCEEQVMTSQAVLTKQQATSDQQLLLLNFNQERFSPSGWKFDGADQFDVDTDPFKLTDAIWSATDCSKAKLRVITYECSSIPAARSFVLSLLGEFDVPGIKRQQNFIVDNETVTIGDVAFADLDELVLIFARANIVVLVQNAAQQVVPVPQFAFQLDAEIARGPELGGEQLPELEEFSISEKEIYVGDEIPVRCHNGSPRNGNGTRFNFFGSGEMFIRGENVLYRPLVGGEQVLTILGRNGGTQTARQELKLSVEQPLTVQEAPCKKLDKSTKEEERVMLDVTGSWSSIRPTSERGSPADLSREGFMLLERASPGGDDLKGSYVDTVNSRIATVTGKVSAVLPNSYRLTLSHPVEGGTRHYDGLLVAIDNGYSIHVVAGQYTDVLDEQPLSDTETVKDSQESGIWVATKP